MKRGRLPWKLAIVLVCATLAHGKANPAAVAEPAPVKKGLNLLLLLGFGVGSGVRSFANNQQHALLILRPVIVNLFCEVRDKAPRWHRNGAIGIKLAAYPPGPGDHRNEISLKIPGAGPGTFCLRNVSSRNGSLLIRA